MAKNIGRDLNNFPRWLHYELLNWSHWCWLGPYPQPIPPRQCGSAERKYLRPRADSDDPRPTPPNTAHAIIVDGVWQRLPQIPKQVLRAEYPQYHESGRAEFGRVGAARRLGLWLRDYEAALGQAVGRVWEAFEP